MEKQKRFIPTLVIIVGLIVIMSGIYFYTKIVNVIQNTPEETNLKENSTGENYVDNSDPEPKIPKVSDDKIMNLSNQGLSQIPSYVFDKKNIEELNVSNNSLTGSIQSEIRHLSNLKVLDASNNNMNGVPAEIGQLSKLEVLDLSNNSLTGLPYELGNLKNLKVLNISGNSYSTQDLDIIREGLPSTVNIIGELN